MSKDRIDTEDLEITWKTIQKYQNYENNTEFYNYLRAVKYAIEVIGEPSADSFSELSEVQVDMVKQICEVYSQLASLKGPAGQAVRNILGDI
ncbi:hypothetical protein [Treponema pectinovorum]|uniref:hypothetical protein n=1 Tax=Treponema pectinovorum TaxID=164 RepID=UPI0011C88A6E|nr:hypothetical protein [Treponema pectinovorum]